MITYETLRRMEQEERNSKKLSRLPEHFFREVREYLARKEAVSEEKGDPREFQAARQRFEDMMELRERKMVNFSLSFARTGAEPEDMLPEERELLGAMSAGLRSFRERREKLVSGGPAVMVAVAFLEDVPQFVGIDMEAYGPFSKGDIATIPEENARVLGEKGAAESVEKAEAPPQAGG